MVGLCDWCKSFADADECTELHLDIRGVQYAFTFHNTLERPCLKEQIEQLRIQFEQSAASATQ